MSANQKVPCERFERWWLDDPTQAASVEHLAMCAACRATAARYQRVAELIENAGATRAMPDGWEDRLLARLDAAYPQQKRRIAPMAEVEALVAKAAPTQINVLLLGETGVGKDVAAERIHKLSPRAGRPFVRLNCAGASAARLEDELFGHEPGAFTGAEQAKPGLLKVAAGGTVFLDEVGEMPMEVQAKLLVAIETQVARRVGATRSPPVDVRFISATHRDLEAEIKRGRFRADFYYRINGLTIRIPPLRERRDELDGLTEQFARDVAVRMGRDRVPDFDDDARAQLHRHAWPGNIRELRSVVERAAVLADGDVVTSRILTAAGLPPFISLRLLRGSVKNAERDSVIAALVACSGNQSHAARMLGITRGTLIGRIRKYGTARPNEQGDSRVVVAAGPRTNALPPPAGKGKGKGKAKGKGSR